MARPKREETKETNKPTTNFERILSQKKYEKIRSSVVSAAEVIKYHDIIPTGSLILDLYLDGGFRPGISRFIGEAEHGKTANALAWAREWQKTFSNGVVVYVNAEGRITEHLLKRSGINQDPKRLLIVNNNVYEEIADLINDFTMDNEEGVRYFFIIDSTDALVTITDGEKDFKSGVTIAGGARMSSQFTKRVSINMGSRGHHLMILSQTRANLAAKAGPGSGGTTESGGKALSFYSSLTGKIDKMSDFAKSYIYPEGSDEEDDDDKKKDKPVPIGNYFSVTFIKSFHEKTRQKVKIPIKRGVGVWREMELFDLCLMYGFLQKKASWHSFDEEFAAKFVGIPVNFQGIWKFVNYLEENPSVTDSMVKYFRDTLIGSSTDKLVSIEEE